VAVLVVAADQTTKSLAVAHLGRPHHLLGPLGLQVAYNTGASFSIFTGFAPALAVVAGALVVGLVWLAWRRPSLPVAAALGLVLGGAIGNLIDRVARGHHGAVVDFIAFTDFPTFNVADACIVVGVAVLGLLLWLRPGPAR